MIYYKTIKKDKKEGEYMEMSQVVRPGVGQYVCKRGALELLEDKLKPFRLPAIVTGEKSFAAFKKHFPNEVAYSVHRYNHTASHEDMDRLANEVPQGTDCIVGVGGGKVLDTAKGVAERLGVDYVTIPTVLGTCAAFAPVAAVYHPDSRFKQVDYFTKSAYLCLVDLNLLIESPERYFMGGIGDTLAKWYEADGIMALQPQPLPAMVEMGRHAAKLTQEILLRDTPDALASMREGKVTPAFERVVETIIAVAGSVGGFAGEYGRMAGAHATHNGMSLVPETHAYEHGVKVAYGILVQLVATHNEAEAKRLLPYYKQNGFPYKLSDFNVTESLEEKMQQVAQFAASDKETFKLVLPNVASEHVYQAMLYLETL